MACRVRTYQDYCECSLCGLTWDKDDPDKPECRLPTRTDSPAYRRAITTIRENLNPGKPKDGKNHDH